MTRLSLLTRTYCLRLSGQLRPAFVCALLTAMLVGFGTTHQAAAGSFARTGQMTTQRAEHTATVLPNGKVLVAGGSGDGLNGLASAELYDPTTGTWSLTGPLVTPRAGHIGVLLANGKVLVAGGYSTDNGQTRLSSAEIYDPASGVWTTTGSMSIDRYAARAVLLNDGKVLVAGGHSVQNGGAYLASAELYDPGSGTWSATGSMAMGRYEHSMAKLNNGKVLVVGNANFPYLSTPELYDTDTGVWTTTGPINTARFDTALTLLKDGRAMVAGGEQAYEAGAMSSVEIFDPATGTWTTTAQLGMAKRAGTATLLPDGKVLASGGSADGLVLAEAEIYDPAEMTWTPTSAMNDARNYGTASLLANGKVLVAGGYTNGGILASAELYSTTLDIVFTSDRTGTNQIWAMRADGSGAHRLLASSFSDSVPAPSHDGTRIAYSRQLDSGVTEVRIMNADGSNDHLVKRYSLPAYPNPGWGWDYCTVWLPDDSQLVVDHFAAPDGHLSTLSLDGLNETTFFSSWAGNHGAIWGVRFSMDGNWMTFSLSGWGEGGNGSNIYKASYANGIISDVQQLTTGTTSNESPCFSPNANLIVELNYADGIRGLHVLGSGSDTNILPVAVMDAVPYDWSPGNQILLTGWPANDANGHIYSVNSDGSGLVALMSGNQTDMQPRWRLVSPAQIQIQTQPAPQEGVWGKSVTFTVAATGAGTLTYQWLKDGQPIDGATGSTLVLSDLQLTGGGNYSVIVTDSLGQPSTSNAALLTVKPADVAIATYAGVTIDGVAGHSYGIQATTDLSNASGWIGVANVTLTQPTQIWYDSQSTAQQPKRFYRVVAGPIPIP